MRYVRLEVREDTAFGSLGLVIKGQRLGGNMNVSTEGLLIAHDLLEHQNGLKAIGGVGDELEALGGVWYVRGQHGQLRRNSMSIHSPEVSLASDVNNLFRYYSQGVPMRVNIPKTREHFQDEAFDEILEESKRVIGEENQYEDYNMSRLPVYLDEARHLLRSGYNKAQRRFEHKGRHYAEGQFWAITEAIDRKMDFNEIHEYQEFSLAYGNGAARFHECYEDEWGY